MWSARLPLWVLVVAAALRPAKCQANKSTTRKFGVCYTRNMVVESLPVNMTDARRKLRKVVLSAFSAKRSGVPTCLFTDLAKALVREVCEWYDKPSDLFDIVLSDGLSDYAPLSAAEARLTSGRGSGVLKDRNLKIRSRIGRITNLGRGPFELTLFVDDDTYFCNSHELLAALRELYKRRGVYSIRASVFAKRPSEDYSIGEALRCAWRHADKEPGFSATLHLRCLDHVGRGEFCSGAQGGAIAIARGIEGQQFADDWRDAYLRYYMHAIDTIKDLKNRSSHAVRSFGGDQAPLAKLMEDHCIAANSSSQTQKNWSFGALPSNFNVRDADRLSKCSAPIFGNLLLLHHKRYVRHDDLPQAVLRLDTLCDKLNRPHALGGAVWLGDRPQQPSDMKPLCSWMRQHTHPPPASIDTLFSHASAEGSTQSDNPRKSSTKGSAAYRRQHGMAAPKPASMAQRRAHRSLFAGLAIRRTRSRRRKLRALLIRRQSPHRVRSWLGAKR